MSRVTVCGLTFIILAAPNVAAARTLVEVEQRTTKGCKIVYYKDASKEDDRKLEKLEWSGSCKGGYAEGDGIATEKWSNGSTGKTVATFRRGREDGQGSFEGTRPDGSKKFFRGNFSRGLSQGSGDLTHEYPNGNSVKYKGNFVDGVPEGQGRMETTQWIYTGEFRENKPSGNGRFEYSNKVVYEGEVRDGKLNGKGKLIYPSGDMVIGYFSDNNPPSSGRVEYHDGAVYEGELEKGAPNGKGRLVYSDKSVYYGSFSNWMPDGEGVVEAPDGRRGNVTASEGKFTRRYDAAEMEAISRAQQQRKQQEEDAQQNQQAQQEAYSASVDACKAKMYSIPASNFAEALANASLCNSNPNAWMNVTPPPRQAPVQMIEPLVQVCAYDRYGGQKNCFSDVQSCIRWASYYGYQCH